MEASTWLDLYLSTHFSGAYASLQAHNVLGTSQAPVSGPSWQSHDPNRPSSVQSSRSYGHLVCALIQNPFKSLITRLETACKAVAHTSDPFKAGRGSYKGLVGNPWTLESGRSEYMLPLRYGERGQEHSKTSFYRTNLRAHARSHIDPGSCFI